MQCINTTIYLDGYKYYIECPKPLKLEVGKFYKTRDGKKAFVFAISEKSYNPLCVAIVGCKSTYEVTANGKYFDGEVTSEDLVAPWEE